MTTFCSSKTPFIVLLSVCFFFFGCSENTDAAKKAPRKRPPASVIIGVVEQELVSDEIEAVGTLQPNESVLITASITENVSSINFEDGQVVNKGDVLVTLTNREQEAEYSEAQANLKESLRQLKRLEAIGSSFATKSEVDLAQASVDANRGKLSIIKARLEDRIIVAPFSGVLGIRRISVGALVTPGTEITRLDDIHVLNLDFTVPEAYSNDLGSRNKVSATNVSLSNKKVMGEVVFFDKRVDPATRAVLVRAKIPNPDLSLLPGMLMNVTLYSKETLSATVAESALQQVGASSSVFVVKPDSTVEKRKVVIGSRLPGKVVINEGLAIGEKVVVDGTLTLRHGSKVTIKNPDLTDVNVNSNADANANNQAKNVTPGTNKKKASL